MGAENDSNSDVKKSKYFHILDEEFKMLCLSISRDILFHVDNIGTPNEFWLNLVSLLRKNDRMRGNQLENEVISLSPTHFEMIDEFFAKFKSLVFQMKQCGI